MLHRFSAIALLASTALLPGGSWAAGITDNAVRIGVLNDQSGPYSDSSGRGSVEAARMAIEDFGPSVKGAPITLIDADHQNKPDVAAEIARRWFERDGIDIIVDLTNTAVALAVSEVARSKDRAALVASSTGSAISGKSCSPNTVHWSTNNYALSKTLTTALSAEGSKSWYFLTVDYAFGHSLEADATKLLQVQGGKALGHAVHPFNNLDFGSYLLQAQSSGADVVALASTGNDLVTAVKQSQEFGLQQSGQRLAALLMQISDTHAIGQEAAQGLLAATAFEWNLDPEKEAWSRRFFKRTGAMPTMVQAALYSGVLHYLQAVDRGGSDTGKEAIDAMRSFPVTDAVVKNGKLRVDGMLVRDMYLVEVKPTSEAKEPWDYYKLLRTIPADEAYQPLEESECPFARH